jgi:N-acetylmuramoyl-L-alanine amidase
MKNNWRKISVGVLLALVILLLVNNNPVRRYLLSLVYQETITPKNLTDHYAQKDFKILVVPGHDNQYRGTEYRGVPEADINLLVASELSNLLAADNHFVVRTTRDFSTGEYVGVFKDFFQSQKDRILAFRNQKKSIFHYFINTGAVATTETVAHNFAPTEVALRLNGINLWANENQMDLTLHLHVNDLAGRIYNQPGAYSGFSIYVPEKQYPNSRASIELARSLMNELKRSIKISNLPQESQGVIEDQTLIAIGSYATREGAAVLLEYGYIYEPQFSTAVRRQQAAKELARLTYDGLIQYLKAR